jgi:putative membrane protein
VVGQQPRRQAGLANALSGPVFAVRLLVWTICQRAKGALVYGFKMPEGFLGTRADMLFDTIVFAELMVVAVLFYAIRQARMRRFGRHRAIMITTLLVLTVVLVLFEANLRAAGGTRVIFRQSSFAGTTAFTTLIYFHLLVAVSTVIAWVTLALTSLIKHPGSLPGPFSRTHRVLGKVVLFGFLTVATTALGVYTLGFVL